MKHIKFFLAGMSTLALVFAIVVTACPSDNSETSTTVSEKTAAKPMISVHPTSFDYLAIDTIEPLKVKATISDTGTMTYQWFEAASFTNSGGTLISGQTTDTYTPARGADGTEKFYYAVVTNTREGLKPWVEPSNPARIRFLSASIVSPPAVNVNITNNQAQYVRGFGGMSNAFGIGAPARYMELQDIDILYHPETGLGFNILRIRLWDKPLDDIVSGAAEGQMGNQIFYEIVKRVNQYGGYVYASPWSPPPQWKMNQSIEGEGISNLMPEHYTDYAQHLANFGRTMAINGAPIYAISVQNEATYPSSWDGCLWTDVQHLNFLLQQKNFLNGVDGFGGGEPLDSVKIMACEPHQNVAWNENVRANAEANSYVGIYAYHTYGRMDNAFRAAQADTADMRKEVWQTEKGIDSGGGGEAQDISWNFVWLVANDIDHTIRINDTNAYVCWYIKRYYSAIGDGAGGSYNHQIMPRGYVMSHWAKFATDTMRVAASITGHPGGGNTTDSNGPSSDNAVNVKVSAYQRKSNPTGYWESQVRHREDSISMVIYDRRTGGQEGADIRINLPSGFEAKYAYGIISDPNRRQAPALVVLAKDGKTADINLPSNSIMSVKFTK